MEIESQKYHSNQQRYHIEALVDCRSFHTSQIVTMVTAVAMTTLSHCLTLLFSTITLPIGRRTLGGSSLLLAYHTKMRPQFLLRQHVKNTENTDRLKNIFHALQCQHILA